MNYNLFKQRPQLEVFHNGDAVRAYNLFGAHFVKWDNRDGVVFRVWAPNALSVSVVGNFNNWNNMSNFMYRISDGAWELFIEGINEFEIYKYCIETPKFKKILKSDPYAFHTETRPANASVVYNIDNFAWTDNNWTENKTTNIKNLPLNVYELHLGSWKKYPDGNFFNYKKMADELVPYLIEMQYTHIQIMPITEYPYDGSWGFQTTGFFAPTSRYGTPKDFMYFVNALHNANIGVFLDWVPSNFPKDPFGLVQFDGTCLYEGDNPLCGERSSWGTCLFNYSRYEVISFLVSSAMFWIENYHIDGLRIGALSSMLYLDYGKSENEWVPNKFGGNENLEAIDFIKRLNTAVHLHHPKVLMFAEENTSWTKLTYPIEEGGLGFDYKWNTGWMKDMLHYMSLNPMWRPFNHDNLTYSFFYAFKEHFILPISHDEVSHGKGSIINKMPGEYEEKFAGVRAFITYMYAHPGKKLIFMGTEIGQFDEWDYKSGIQWDLLSFESHSKLKLFFKDINKFYLENAPFYEQDSSWKGFDWIHHDDFTQSVIAFKRTDVKGNEIVVVCNFQPTVREKYLIGVPKNGIYSEVFSSDDVKYGGNGVTNGKNIKSVSMKIHGYEQGISLTLPPLSVVFFKCIKELNDTKSE